MLTGLLGRILALGVILCGIFAGSTYYGGWLAYGVGVGCAIACVIVFGLWSVRRERTFLILLL